MLSAEKQLEIVKRGAVEIIREPELIGKIRKSIETGIPLRVKAGFDPTAPDIHLGHTVLLEKMRDFQEIGHTAILLVGDFTGMIGDPTGKSETRKPLAKEEVIRNAHTYTEQAFKILDRSKTQVVFNSDWLELMPAAEMIKLQAKLTVARMLEREDFKQRFSSQGPIGIHEFIYPLLQGYDSVALKADVELGGTDQRFNLLMGRELQQEYGQPPQVVVIMPLLEGLDGVKKMSKSLGNYIGINEPAVEYVNGEFAGMFKKVMSIPDQLIDRYFELLSHISLEELSVLKNSLKEKTLDPREAKKRLAMELVTRYHDRNAAEEALNKYEDTFERKKVVDIPEATVSISEGPNAGRVPQILKGIGLVPSTSEAMRLMKQGGVRINDVPASDPRMTLNAGEYIVKVGKSRFCRIRVEP